MCNLRRILFLSGFLLLIGAALFPIEIVLACVKYQASNYCKKALGAKLGFESLTWENGRIVCKNGSLIKSGNLHATFDEAILDPLVNLKGRELGGELDVKGLRIVNRKTRPQKLPCTSSPSFPFLTLNLKTSINEGKVILYDYFGTSPLFQSLKFDLEHHVLGGQTFGSIACDWGENEPKLMTRFWHGEDAAFHVQTDFRSHCFPALYDVMTYFFHAYLPEPLTLWKLDAGKINGNLECAFVNGDPMQLKGTVNISDIHAENPFLELISEVDHLDAQLDVDFSSLKTMNGEIFLQGGRLALDQTGEFWQGLWDLRHLHTCICVKEGKVESSVIRGDFMGMDGQLVLDWQSQGTLMSMGFEGQSDQIGALFPKVYQENFREAFIDDHFAMKAALSRSGEGLELEGALTITGDEEHLLTFGCLFGQGNEEIEVVPETLPFSLSRSVDSFLDHIAHQFCLSQKRFGWFNGHGFPLEKFLSPFLFANSQMDATGRADFQGTFDERYLVISYEGKDFHLESPNFYLHTDCTEEKMCTDVVAVHYIDLETWNHVGFLPLRNTTYYQKNRDLLFNNGQAMVHFENNLIHIQDVEAYWNALMIKGNIEIATKSPDHVELMIHSDYLAGPASDAQKMLSHLSDSVFWEIPFEGEVQSSGEVFSFLYHFTPTAELVSGNIQADFHGSVEKPHLECIGHVEYDLNAINIEMTTPLCSFHALITGDAILIDGDNISLHADRDKKGMQITEFTYGPWEGEGDLEWQGRDIVLHNFLLKETEKNGEFAFSGFYNREGKLWKGSIDSLQWDFGKTPSIWKPQGEIYGSGTFEGSISDGLQAFLAASFKNLEFGGIHFGDGDDLICSYHSNYGLTVEGLEVEIPTEKGVTKYKLGRFFSDLTHQKFLFEGFDFSLPPEKLPWVAELAGDMFPDRVHPVIVDWVEELKQNEPLEGRVSLEVYPDSVWVHLSLKDGTYNLSDNLFSFKNFQLLYDPLEFNVWTKVFYRDDFYWVHLVTDSMTTSHGKLEISEYELSPDIPVGPQAVVAHWERRPEKGFCVKDVQGSFHGISMDLSSSGPMNFSDQVELEGQISLDTGEVRSLLSDQLVNFVDSLSISGNYALEGAFTIPKSDYSQFSFSGILSGSDFVFAGVELGLLTSDLDYQPDHISLKNVNVKDWAGRLTISQADIVRDMGTWALSCDALKVEEMRLSRVKSPWTQRAPRDKPLFRSLFVRNFDLNDFHADLNDLESFTGNGILEFSNLPKKSLLSNLLFIPTEITARIGLDLTALIPARGIIDYQIANKKIYFNEFKDMYSDGKYSRFYLAEGASAYVDFGGNLNFKLKMKQYNLLMKLAELFTISVKGTLLNPNYTFTNQYEG